MTDNNKNREEKTVETKQSFLANAISDISAYIQLIDTKVSIIMAAAVAVLVGIIACYEPIEKAVSNMIPCSWTSVLFIISVTLGFVSIILMFLFGNLTLRSHYCKIDYTSNWFLSKSIKEYSFDEFSNDIDKMTDEDIIKNMSAELYKLNDINRQKMKTMKWTLLFFSIFLVTIAIIVILFLLNTI